ncbi:hypothetical protein KSP35_17035 [Aquihabitans sp. G128]|uniref:hypothetical protein n=1 Tax=Aquihabitans sp. G128 TaxID=2849779 RepID=UPI001C21AA82|nr:hypothetical protein [Aquihabitans sp. G128]QXC60054.1 hypothetical protein KSP35_17035 [Aquihabitans sp. G128]
MISMRSIPPGLMGPAPHHSRPSRPPRPKAGLRRLLVRRAVRRLVVRVRGVGRPVVTPATTPAPADL